jgi:hypothetical protein
MKAALLPVDGRSNELPVYLVLGNEDPVYQQLEGVQLLIER